MFIQSGKLTKANPTDAGWDIHSSADINIYPQERVPIPTNLKIAIDAGFVGIVKERSGLAFNRGIETKAGVIDADYRGEVKVLLKNDNNHMFKIKKGDRIAQFLIVPINLTEFTQVEELPPTNRGENGFGSSGI